MALAMAAAIGSRTIALWLMRSQTLPCRQAGIAFWLIGIGLGRKQIMLLPILIYPVLNLFRFVAAIQLNHGFLYSLLLFRSVFQQLILHAVYQGLPAGLNDISRNPDGAPGVILILGLNEHPYPGGGAGLFIQHPHLKVRQMHPA